LSKRDKYPFIFKFLTYGIVRAYLLIKTIQGIAKAVPLFLIWKRFKGPEESNMQGGEIQGRAHVYLDIFNNKPLLKIICFGKRKNRLSPRIYSSITKNYQPK